MKGGEHLATDHQAEPSEFMEHSLIIDFVGRLRGLPPARRRTLARAAQQEMENLVQESLQEQDEDWQLSDNPIDVERGLRIKQV